MSRGNRVIQFRVTEEAYQLMEIARQQRNLVSSDSPQDMSAWVRHACTEKLNHLRRGKQKKKEKHFTCTHCGLARTLAEIDHTVQPMWGRKEYVCTSCVIVTLPTAKSFSPVEPKACLEN